MKNLANEGLSSRSILVGDVMTDVLYQVRDRVLAGAVNNPILATQKPHEYYLATLHRAENTDDPHHLQAVLNALSCADKPVVLLAHPRVRAKVKVHGLDAGTGSLIMRDPLTYPELIAAALDSSGVITDSGGLQKEAFLLRVPCTTMRTETEWVETVETGWNALASDAETLLSAICRPLPPETEATPYGIGDTARQAVNELVKTFG